MSDLLAPISKSTTRAWSTCTNGSVRGISLVRRVQKQWQSAVKLGSRPNFRTDHAGFPKPFRLQSFVESIVAHPDTGPTLQFPWAVDSKVGWRLPSEGKGHTFESRSGAPIISGTFRASAFDRVRRCHRGGTANFKLIMAARETPLTSRRLRDCRPPGVRSTLKSRHPLDPLACPLCARNGSKLALLPTAPMCGKANHARLYRFALGAHKLSRGSGDYSELRLQPIGDSAGDLCRCLIGDRED
jgi:hypothetical protein